jgi:HK97 family phage prohead protease
MQQQTPPADQPPGEHEHEARDHLHAPRGEVRCDDGAVAGTFSGYGAFFGNVDAYGDVIAKGAFKDTLRDWRKDKRLPPMLVQHGGWMMSDQDGLPIGKWTAMGEDEKGLTVEGRLINLDTERGKAIYGAMKEGVLDGLSIGYRAKEFALGTKPEEPRRTLKKVDLIEVSVVTFPANGEARVQAVKSGAAVSRPFVNSRTSCGMQGVTRTLPRRRSPPAASRHRILGMRTRPVSRRFCAATSQRSPTR